MLNTLYGTPKQCAVSVNYYIILSKIEKQVFIGSDPDLLDSKASIFVCLCIMCCLEDAEPILSRDNDPGSKEKRPYSLITGC